MVHRCTSTTSIKWVNKWFHILLEYQTKCPAQNLEILWLLKVPFCPNRTVFPRPESQNEVLEYWSAVKSFAIQTGTNISVRRHSLRHTSGGFPGESGSPWGAMTTFCNHTQTQHEVWRNCQVTKFGKVSKLHLLLSFRKLVLNQWYSHCTLFDAQYYFGNCVTECLWVWYHTVKLLAVAQTPPQLISVIRGHLQSASRSGRGHFNFRMHEDPAARVTNIILGNGQIITLHQKLRMKNDMLFHAWALF